MSRCGSLLPGLLVVALALVLAAATATAAEDWRLTARSDRDLLALVAELEGGADRAAADRESGLAAVCLLHERIFECEKGRYRVTDNVVYRVHDVERSDVATRHYQFPPRSRVEGAGTWVLRGDQVLRGAKDAVTVIKGQDLSPTEVVLTAAGVRDGDVVGFTVQRGEERTYPGLTMMLAGEYPVRLQRVRIRTDGHVAYHILGRNLVPGSFGVEVLERLRGTESHTVAEIRDIAVLPDGPYAPPPMSSAPLVSMSWRGTLDPSIGRWLFLGSWSEAAVWIESEMEELTESDRELERTARSLVEGKAGPGERLQALHDFVRREIVPTDGWETGTELRAAGEVLAARNGTAFEAGTLLCALAQAADVPVRPVFARSTDWGPIDNDNPGLAQFSDLLVEDLSSPGTYFAPGRRDCAGGLLPDDLVGATALVLAPDLAAKDRALVEDVFSSADRDVGRLVAIYQQRAAREPWQTMFRLPGNVDQLRGMIQETVTGTAGSDTFAVSLVVQERAGCRDEDEDADPEAHFREHMEEHFPEASASGGAAGAAPGALTGRLVLAIGTPQGDVWQLDAGAVYGAPFLDDWDGVEDGAFHLSSTMKETRTWRLHLPEGWRLATTHPELQVTHARFRARARALAIGGDLVVWREREYLRGVTAGAGLADLETAIGRVKDYEAAPIILERVASPTVPGKQAP